MPSTQPNWEEELFLRAINITHIKEALTEYYNSEGLENWLKRFIDSEIKILTNTLFSLIYRERAKLLEEIEEKIKKEVATITEDRLNCIKEILSLLNSIRN